MLDLFGLGKINILLEQGAISGNPNIDPNTFIDSINFGLNYGSKELATFLWNGFQVDFKFIGTRIVWICISLILILISSLVFDRFRKNTTKSSSLESISYTIDKSLSKKTNKHLSLSPISKSQHINFLLLVKGELKIMLSELSFMQIGILILGIALHFFLPNNGLYNWLSLFLLVPTSLWARMGCRDKEYRTEEFVSSRCDMRIKWIAAGISGLIIAFIVSSGAILHFVFTGNWVLVASWLVGMYFIVSMALAFGTLTGSKRLFEGVFIVWLYVGHIQDVSGLNFISNSVKTIILYGIIGLIFTVIGYFTVSLKEKRITKIKNR